MLGGFPSLAYDLAQNLAASAFVVLAYTFVVRRPEGWGNLKRQGVFGLFMGLTAVFSMMHPIHIGPGIFIDARTPLVGLTALFGGPLAAVVTAALAAAYRFSLGGAGMAAGMANPALSLAAGVGFSWWVTRGGRVLRLRYLFGFGLLLGGCSLSSLLLLPSWALTVEVFDRTVLPFLTMLPLGTLFLGALLLREQRHRDAELRMAESEARYRLLADNVTDMILVIRAGGEIAYVSPSVREILGHEPAEIVGRHAAALLHPDDQRPAAEAFSGLESGSPTVSVIHRIRHRDGRFLWAESSMRPARDASGAFTVVAAVRDVTERKLYEEQLHEARAAAEAGNRVKSEFLASMSHEIRTPLNGVIGFADLLLGTELTAEQRQYVALQREAGRGLLAIIGDILDYSKIEAGKLELEERGFDLHRLMRDARDLMSNAASQKGLALELALGASVPRFVRGDESRIRQILLNLLGNAVKFTERGSVLLSVGVLSADEATGVAPLRFSVSDTGTGIAPSEQSNLFQRFSQGDSSTTRRYGGTGLGLIISKQLSELMGGRIGFHSSPGIGSTFWFELPLPAAVEGKTDGKAEGRPAAAPGRRTARILLAEDVPMNQIVTSSILCKAGHMVEVAEDGEAAVEAVRTGQFDLILMDMQMPRMDGVQATTAIRGMEGGRRAVPIVALTANALPDQLQRCLDAGMNDHVTKPIERDTLLATVDRWLGMAPQVQATLLAGAQPADAHPPVPTRPDKDVVLDPATLAALADTLGEEALPRFVAGTLSELHQRIGRVLDPASPKDAGFDAHAMVSLAGNLGLVELSRLARKLQHACEQGRTDAAAALKEEVQAALARASHALGEALPGGVIPAV
ncbi:ATP-binding protein [Azospirillum doebereinerae]|uniref:ATP-binding protein n=1 Tax=Azospirillum doebereinerae TaxID=92933 RepID=UPI001EE5A24B|nr:ATP-binding protein [Azospirillum doebereinerae]MCG5242054.1 ATP-binding protein [Azospirillum doebereinerae]